MSLYLVESILSKQLQERADFEQTIDQLASKLTESAGKLVEVQVANDLSRAFFIVNSEAQADVLQAFRAVGLPATLVKPVRLVGQELVEITTKEAEVNYVVEWNLPEGLTMDKYLARKKEKSPLYAQVPESTFLRTYVCEDLTKCLCFYKAPDEQAVRKARDVVDAPVDSITKLASRPTKGD